MTPTPHPPDPTRFGRTHLCLEGLVGRSAALECALREAAIVARHDVSVLLTGEAGTGKTQLARMIHRSSRRAGGPFVEVSCPNLPPELIENELFGRERGAFTGAASSESGKVAAAENGTLFLDEIGELPLAAQPKLLMLLNDGTYYRLGARVSQRADVRILAATNRDLDPLIAAGRFRRDLYDRVAELSICVPPLRERREDIPALVAFLVDDACKSFDLPPIEVAPAAVGMLGARSWPGNVRELRNCLRVALLRAEAEGATRIGARHIDEHAPTPGCPEPRSLASVTREARRALLVDVLGETGWNIAAAARIVGASRSHVNSLIAELGLRRPQPEPPMDSEASRVGDPRIHRIHRADPGSPRRTPCH